MTAARDWVAGARPRTLPAAVSPVLAGTATAIFVHGFHPLRALLCLVVSLALQVGVNYANDYSDGIRGTDADRVGPMRLVGSGAATPGAVKRAAFGCFAVAGVAGLVLTLLTGHWWFLGVGALCIAAAWFYTGGRRPYGYLGLGEVNVFVFFGLVAVGGTHYVQTGRLDVATGAAAVGVGCVYTAVLVVNNLRDRAGDQAVGKRTLATRLGDRGTRALYVSLMGLGLLSAPAVAVTSSPWALLGLAAIGWLVPAVRTVLSGATGRALIPVLGATGLTGLVLTLGWTAGLAWAAYR